MTNSNKSSDQGPPERVRSLSAALDRVRSQPGKQSATPREAAVLVLLIYGPDGVQVLLTERASGLRSYPGRVSFPGGAKDPADADPTATALREAHEEIGLDRASVKVLGSLSRFVDPEKISTVTPVLAWSARPKFTGPVSAAEVAKVLQVAIRDLPSARGEGQASTAPAINLGQMTAKILDAVVALLKRPNGQ
jgi:8-oxo-dGTP pyrophosphatase MutT (NUDIX family)